MGQEIDLLENYPKAKRNLEERLASKNESDRAIARKFGHEFFDGDRNHGYGGFNYMPRFWQPVIPTFKEYWDLTPDSSLLDVGCAKGFMLHDLTTLIPGITVKGVDISEYAIDNVMEDMKPHTQVANAMRLPFADDAFDVVISINTIHNLEIDQCAMALREISRVSKKYSFITVDAFRNKEEEKKMFEWNLTAKTILSVSDWIKFFEENNYKGDYYWFVP